MLRAFRRLPTSSDYPFVYPLQPDTARCGSLGGYVALDQDRLVIIMPFSQELIRKIKNIPGRLWDPQKKHWTVPNNECTLDVIQLLFADEVLELDAQLKQTAELGAKLRERPEGIADEASRLKASTAYDVGEDAGLSLSQVVGETLKAIRVRHLSPRSGRAYVAWIMQFFGH